MLDIVNIVWRFQESSNYYSFGKIAKTISAVQVHISLLAVMKKLSIVCACVYKYIYMHTHTYIDIHIYIIITTLKLPCLDVKIILKNVHFHIFLLE